MNPAKEIAWLNVEKINVNPNQTTILVITAGKNQALTYNFGSMQLGRIFIDVDAPQGTIFDLIWSEDLGDSLVTLYKNVVINAEARFISRSGKQHFETFRPYGLHYLQVTVRNHKEDVTVFKAGVKRQVFQYLKKGSFSCSDTLMNNIWN